MMIRNSDYKLSTIYQIRSFDHSDAYWTSFHRPFHHPWQHCEDEWLLDYQIFVFGGEYYTISKWIFPSHFYCLLHYDTAAHSFRCVSEEKITFLWQFGHVHPFIHLFLDLYYIFDEMFDIEESCQLWVALAHGQKFLSLNDHYFVLRN